MSLVQESNKEIAKVLHNSLKSKGHSLPLGHVYEALSQLAGHKNWNIANAGDVDFSKHLFEKNVVDVEEIKDVTISESLQKHTNELKQMMGEMIAEPATNKVTKGKKKEVSMKLLMKRKDKIYGDFKDIFSTLSDQDIDLLAGIEDKAAKLSYQITSHSDRKEADYYPAICLKEMRDCIAFIFNFMDY